MQFFDLVLHIPAAAINSIHSFRLERDVGNDIATIAPCPETRPTISGIFRAAKRQVIRAQKSRKKGLTYKSEARYHMHNR